MLLLVSGATRTVDRYRAHAHLGRLLRPGNGNGPDELPWAIDNGAYAGFDENAWWALVSGLQGAPGCLWVVAPDVVTDAKATLVLYDTWERRIRDLGFPVAFVAQDGQTSESVPWDRLDCLFIGGTTEFKLGSVARELASQARARGKLVHMGRVNSIRRMQYAYDIGCDSVDGTSFSKFPDRWIPWGLRALARITAQVSMFRMFMRERS